MDRAFELFQRNVLALMKARGWTKTELARRAKMSKSQLGTYLGDGKVKVPSLAIVSRIAEAFGVTPARLLRSDDEAPSLVSSFEDAVGLLDAVRSVGFDDERVKAFLSGIAAELERRKK